MTQRKRYHFSFSIASSKLSTGMGLAQMMGFSYALIGYESVDQMFDAFSSSERYQVYAVFDAIAGPAADPRQLEALGNKDFDTFAALHYGTGQAANDRRIVTQAPRLVDEEVNAWRKDHKHRRGHRERPASSGQPGETDACGHRRKRRDG